MNRRKDAFLAAAKMSPEIYRIAERNGGVCTIGSCLTKPGIVTSVVEECRITLDQRHLDARGAGADVAAKRRKRVSALRREGNVTVSWERLWQIEPMPFDRRLIDLCDECDPRDLRQVAPPAVGPAARRGRGRARRCARR